MYRPYSCQPVAAQCHPATGMGKGARIMRSGATIRKVPTVEPQDGRMSMPLGRSHGLPDTSMHRKLRPQQ
jgi:hypothetical protein